MRGFAATCVVSLLFVTTVGPVRAADEDALSLDEFRPEMPEIELAPLMAPDPAQMMVKPQPEPTFAMPSGLGGFYAEPDELAPAAKLMLAEPPQAVKRKGVGPIVLASINGAVPPPGSERRLRVAPGSHELALARRYKGAETQVLTLDVEADVEYSIGWQETDGSWEPTVYQVKRTRALPAPVVNETLDTVAAAAAPAPTTSYDQPEAAAPAGRLLMAEPPQAVKRKGVRSVVLTRINGEAPPAGSERRLRVEPGVHEFSFTRRYKGAEERVLTLDVQPGTEYSVGWRETDGDWEPVVYEVKRARTAALRPAG